MWADEIAVTSAGTAEWVASKIEDQVDIDDIQPQRARIISRVDGDRTESSLADKLCLTELLAELAS